MTRGGMEMETSEEKKERLALAKELESVLGRILIVEEHESVLREILPANCMVIDPAPVAGIRGCHAKEIGQIEGIRKYMAIRCGMIIKTLKPSRTNSARFVAMVAQTAFKKNDVALSALAQKLVDCHCNYDEYVDPI